MSAESSRRPTLPREARRPKADLTPVIERGERRKPRASTNVAAEPAPAELAGVHLGSLLFDPDWYRTRYPDVMAAGLDPIRHYFDNGAAEGRDPNPFFVTSWYLATYSDVVASRMNPFLHYLLYGAREGRKPNG